MAFLDDDVRVGPHWRAELVADLAGQPADVAGVQGVIEVPLPPDRRPTDWERGTAGLASARWITADMAYRRRALIAAGGFDERFPRAFREDADLALRLLDQGWALRRGQRRDHPPGPARVPLGQPEGPGRQRRRRADDAAARPRLVPAGRGAPGRRRGHLLTSAALALAALAAGGRAWSRPGRDGGPHRTGRLTAPRRPGRPGWPAPPSSPRPGSGPGRAPRHEITTMAITSALIPPLAVRHWLRGQWRHRKVTPWPPPPAAVLFDRDGTLVRDVPYNGRPELVEPMPGATVAVARLRAAGVRLGVVTNQSGVGRGLITAAQMKAVNQRVEEPARPVRDVGGLPPRPGRRLRLPQARAVAGPTGRGGARRRSR